MKYVEFQSSVNSNQCVQGFAELSFNFIAVEYLEKQKHANEVKPAPAPLKEL